VSFCFLLFLGLGLWLGSVIGLGLGFRVRIGDIGDAVGTGDDPVC